MPRQPQPPLEDRRRWDASTLARPRRVEAILRLASQQDERVVERPDQPEFRSWWACVRGESVV